MVYGASPAGPLPRNRVALALIFGMHMLALFAWMRQRPAPLPSVPDLPQVVTILLQPSLPQTRPKPGVPDEPDTPMARFRRGLEAAHVDRSMSVHFDTYTSPDGTIYYRKRIGNSVICRRSGNIGPLGMKGMEMGGESADKVRCPSGVAWTRD